MKIIFATGWGDSNQAELQAQGVTKRLLSYWYFDKKIQEEHMKRYVETGMFGDLPATRRKKKLSVKTRVRLT
jgi:hypothetical protein